MPARRFFVRDRRAAGESIAIEGSDVHKIAHVLRLRTGDRIEIVDSAAQLFFATVEINGELVSARLDTLIESTPQPHARIDVAQGIPKGAKMDYVVEKLGELGVHRLFPLQTERTVAGGAGAAKVDRWRRLAHSASAQSGRRDVMQVSEPFGMRDLYERIGEYDLVLFPWEAAAPEPLGGRLPALLAGASRVLVVIGPEGGFSHAEAEAARAAGAELVSLGHTILRTETAALVTVAILGYELDRKVQVQKDSSDT
jgi:16S rRNA (uracil1498-N3)-methyltransferase